MRGSETGKRKGMHWEKRTLCHQKSHTFCVVCVLLYVQWVCLFVCLFVFACDMLYDQKMASIGKAIFVAG